MQLQLHRMDLRLFLVGREDAGLRAGNGDCAGQVGIIGVKNIKRTFRIPLHAGHAIIALRPHPFQIRRKAQSEIRGTQAVKFEQHHRSRARRRVTGRKHDLAHREPDMRIRNDGAVGADFDLRGLPVHVDGHVVAFDVGFDGQVREQLDGQQPSFEGAVLSSGQHTAFARYGKGLLRFGVGTNHRAGIIERKRGNGSEARGLAWLEAVIAEATASSMVEAMRKVVRRLYIVWSFACGSKPTVYSGSAYLCRRGCAAMNSVAPYFGVDYMVFHSILCLRVRMEKNIRW